MIGSIRKSFKGLVYYLNLGIEGTLKLLSYLVLPGQKWAQVNWNSNGKGKSKIFAHMWVVSTPSTKGGGNSLVVRIIRVGI